MSRHVFPFFHLIFLFISCSFFLSWEKFPAMSFLFFHLIFLFISCHFFTFMPFISLSRLEIFLFFLSKILSFLVFFSIQFPRFHFQEFSCHLRLIAFNYPVISREQPGNSQVPVKCVAPREHQGCRRKRQQKPLFMTSNLNFFFLKPPHASRPCETLSGARGRPTDIDKPTVRFSGVLLAQKKHTSLCVGSRSTHSCTFRAEVWLQRKKRLAFFLLFAEMLTSKKFVSPMGVPPGHGSRSLLLGVLTSKPHRNSRNLKAGDFEGCCIRNKIILFVAVLLQVVQLLGGAQSHHLSPRSRRPPQRQGLHLHGKTNLSWPKKTGLGPQGKWFCSRSRKHQYQKGTTEIFLWYLKVERQTERSFCGTQTEGFSVSMHASDQHIFTCRSNPNLRKLFRPQHLFQHFSPQLWTWNPIAGGKSLEHLGSPCSNAHLVLFD